MPEQQDPRNAAANVIAQNVIPLRVEALRFSLELHKNRSARAEDVISEADKLLHFMMYGSHKPDNDA